MLIFAAAVAAVVNPIDADLSVYFKDIRGKPLFIRFWQPDHEESMLFEPVWHDFLLETGKNPPFRAESVNCWQFPELCKAFGIISFPSVVWYDPNRRSAVEYYDGNDLQKLLHFVERRTSFPFLFIEENEIIELGANARESPTFVLEFTNESDLDLVKPVILANSDKEFTFAVVKSEVRKLKVIKDFDFEINYNSRNWTAEKVSLWIEINIIPFYTQITDQLFDLLVRSGKIIGLSYMDELRTGELAKEVGNLVIFMKDTEDSKYRDACGASKGTRVIFYNPRKNLCYNYKLDQSVPRFMRWVNRTLWNYDIWSPPIYNLSQRENQRVNLVTLSRIYRVPMRTKLLAAVGALLLMSCARRVITFCKRRR